MRGGGTGFSPRASGSYARRATTAPRVCSGWCRPYPRAIQLPPGHHGAMQSAGDMLDEAALLDGHPDANGDDDLQMALDEPTLVQAQPKCAAAADTDAKMQQSLKAEVGTAGERPWTEGDADDEHASKRQRADDAPDLQADTDAMMEIAAEASEVAGALGGDVEIVEVTEAQAAAVAAVAVAASAPAPAAAPTACKACMGRHRAHTCGKTDGKFRRDSSGGKGSASKASKSAQLQATVLGLVDMPDDPSTLVEATPVEVVEVAEVLALNVEETDEAADVAGAAAVAATPAGAGASTSGFMALSGGNSDDAASKKQRRRVSVASRWTAEEEATLRSLVAQLTAEAAAEGCKKGKEGKLTTKRWDLVAERLGGGRSASSIQQHWDVMHGKHPRSKPKTDLAAAGIDPSLLSWPQVCMGTVVSNEGEVGVTLSVKPAQPSPEAAAAALQAAKLALAAAKQVEAAERVRAKDVVKAAEAESKESERLEANALAEAEAERQAAAEGLVLEVANTTGGYRGVKKDMKHGRGSGKCFEATIGMQGEAKYVQKSLGYFATAKEAALAYARAKRIKEAAKTGGVKAGLASAVPISSSLISPGTGGGGGGGINGAAVAATVVSSGNGGGGGGGGSPISAVSVFATAAGDGVDVGVASAADASSVAAVMEGIESDSGGAAMAVSEAVAWEVGAAGEL